ncbi:MAG: helix-turn-helix domain-containing protein [Lachnospiraceae bacterium]|nr:helix-turn-helix domain-containing protein [Lachnospiraceae bacterium]
MELKIGENIKRLRKAHDITQEDFANILGVSSQSVSRWEKGVCYPDMELLPSLAGYFKISVDELLGIGDLEKSRKYDEINATWKKNNEKGLHSENAALMRKALKNYPNDSLLLVQLSTSLEKIGGTAEEKRLHLADSIAIQEQILRYGEDSEVRGATMYNICISYMKNGEPEKAIEQAEKLPNLYKARENALIYFLEGAERRRISEDALTPLSWALAKHLTVLAEETNNSTYRTKADRILDLLWEGREENEVVRKAREELKG